MVKRSVVVIVFFSLRLSTTLSGLTKPFAPSLPKAKESGIFGDTLSRAEGLS